MRRRYFILTTALLIFAVKVQCQDTPPLKLIQTLTLPADVKGNFDHFGVDLKGHRLFATPEDYKAVLVFDPHTGKPIHTIGGGDVDIRNAIDRGFFEVPGCKCRR